MKMEKETGITGLEAVFLFIILAIAGYLVFSLACSPSDQGGTVRGLVPRAIEESGDSVRVTGMPVGYSSISRRISGVDAVAARENEKALGFLVISVTPVIGDLAIDTDRMGIAVVVSQDRTHVSRSRDARLLPGNWTIVKKYNMIPMKSADDDDILEASEIFDLLISLPEPLFAYQEFSIMLSPEHGVPFTQKLTVPRAITPVTELA